MRTRHLPSIAAAAVALAIAVPSSTPSAQDEISSAIRSAVDHPDRPEADRERDAGRRPAEVLAFFGIQPGMTVLDVNSAGGYYSELLSRIVGTQGKVIAHNDELYSGFVADRLGARYGDDRLPNVELVQVANSELDLGEGKADAALMVLVYHDYFFVPEQSPSRTVDVADTLARIHRALKPGGMLGVVDHAAPAGSGSETGNTTHRIAPELVKAELLAAGFELEAESSLLRNPADDLQANVFDPKVRGKTDRFVYRFRKAAGPQP